MNTLKSINWRTLLLITFTSLVLMSCSKSNDTHTESGGHGAAAPVIEKGTHNGRLLNDKSFTLELAIFETGVPPEFRAWGFDDGKPVAPKEIDLKIKLTRFGNKIDAISFVPDGDFLRSTISIYEPHSFIVNITATYKGKAHQWSYESLEGRTKIEAKVAEALEIKSEIAGPATLEETIDVYGNVIADPALERAVSARFDGIITAVHVGLGDRVTQGQALFTVESNESLKSVAVHAPISGVVTLQNARVGEQSQGKTLLRIIDNSKTYAELAIFPSQLAQVTTGASVTVNYQNSEIAGVIDFIANEVNPNQSVTARVKLEKAQLPVGAQLSAKIKVAEHKVPLAVKRVGLQAFRDFTVVYAQVGDEYEVRMLELGREAGDWVEVLGGLEPGTRYVTENSFVVKADIEKSGASHDH